ncbi:MAG: sugar ABC transporter ATP-binding protein, partial [Chloroflexota bacterium]
SKTDQSAPILLELKGIVKRFPGVTALAGVDFQLHAGEVHLLLGENGAGKSTLVKIISGAYHPDGGEILMNGKPVVIDSPQRAAALGISTIYQEFNLAPSLSVAENVFLGRLPRTAFGKIDWVKVHRDTERILEMLDTDISSHDTVGNLNVAHKQLVEIAKALSQDARILIMDEPTAALTAHETEQLFKIVHSLKSRGVAIIYISHRLEEGAEIGDSVTVLRDGQRIGSLSMTEATIDKLVQMMVGRQLDDMFPKVVAPIGEEVLRVEGLSKAKQFEDVSFSLRAGEILGITGLVGSGGVPLSKSIFGAGRLERGRIFVRGKLVDISSPAVAIQHGIGLLPEDRKDLGLVLKLSIKENITLAALDRFSRMGILNLREERRLAEGYKEKLDIATPTVDKLTRLLSGGNQQKVVLAKWLCSQTSILLFVEPTRGVDVGAKVEIYNLMNELVKDGAAILMVSSDLPEVLGMSDRILVMRNGRVVAEMSRQEATQEKVLLHSLGAESLSKSLQRASGAVLEA